MFDELRHRDPLLFWTGVAMLLAFVVVTLLSIGDTRLVAGINPWIKPMKFLVSITIYVWSVAWFMPETTGPGETERAVVSGLSRTHIDKRQVVRWAIALGIIIEIVGITFQAARGRESHFNNQSPLDVAIFAVLGFTIFFVNSANMLFLWLIRRDTPPSRAGYIWGIRLGLALFLLGTFEGGIMIFINAHTIGASDGGPGLPFINWSTTHGDLRAAHFFGLHALQALPLIGFLSNSRNLVIAASILWLAVMSGLLTMALQGRPLLAL